MMRGSRQMPAVEADAGVKGVFGIGALAGTLFVVLVSIGPVAAAPSPAMTACLKSWLSAQGSDNSEARKLMAQGPDAVLATLTDEQRKAIRDYITITETIKFRCSRFTPPPPLNPRRK